MKRRYRHSAVVFQHKPFLLQTIHEAARDKVLNGLQLTIYCSENVTILCESDYKIASPGSCTLGQAH